MSTSISLFNFTAAREPDEGIARTQAAFDYLNTSGRPSAASIRAFLDSCFSHYPEAHRAPLAKMIGSKQDPLHAAGIFELLVHELIYRQIGGEVEVEPQIGSKNKRPDFLVASKGAAPMVVEVTVANENSSTEHAQSRQRAQVLSVLDGANSPRFWLDLHFSGYASVMPKLSTLKEEFQVWIDALPNELEEAKSKSFTKQFHDLRITVKPILPKKEEHPERPFGAEGPGIKVLRIGDNSRNSLKVKFKKYGDLGLPFVVALNGCGMGAGLRDIDAALFGTTVYNQATESIYRDSDGLLSPTQNTRVSAVLYFHDVSAWSIGSRRSKPTLIHNPWAIHPLKDNPFGVGSASYGVAELSVQDGPCLADIFGLPVGWPSDE